MNLFWKREFEKHTFISERKYPSLCEKCYNPYRCDKGDKYWGRTGPLDCLTSGDGDVAWVRLSDVQSHFGVSKYFGVIQYSRTYIQNSK